MPDNATNAGSGESFHPAGLRTLEKAIRRIVRANDLRSRALVKAVGLTYPQLVVLKAIAALGEVTTTALSAHADLSTATVITILDNLEERGIIQRYRSLSDRRIVHTRLTAKGQALVANAPEAMGEAFAGRLARLPERRRKALVSAVVELADMLAPVDAGSAERANELPPIRRGRRAEQPPGSRY